jgi:diaminopimelate decarboxylase/aspartate kinase
MTITSDSQWVVLKFGGTSVSKRERWDTIGRLAQSRLDEGKRVLVVVSAVSGVTNLLLAAAEGRAELDAQYAQIADIHVQFAHTLGLAVDGILAERLKVLHHLMCEDARRTMRSFDWQAEVLAQGELLSSSLGAAYLGTQGFDMRWTDARDWLSALALPNQSEWSKRLSVNCAHDHAPDVVARLSAAVGQLGITQGFISRHADGGTAILGRGGSDTSAAYFGALLKADRVEIWTDVPGLFSANPREVPEARLLSQLDHAEAQEIATTGAKVLHPRAIGPCRDADIEIRILDTSNPSLGGTRIARTKKQVRGVKAISRRNGIVLVSMESIGMWQQVGFLSDIFERFKAHGLSVDLIGSSETNVTVSLDPSENLVSTDVLERLSADLSTICKVKVIAPCAAITLVGRGMRSMLHKLSDVWATFGRERVHLISQSSNDLNLTFVIDEADADGMIPLLHAELIRSGAMPIREREVFGQSWRQLVNLREVEHSRWWTHERARLTAIGTQHGPTYVYHLPTVRERAAQLNAITSFDARFYAMKANSNPVVLREIDKAGFGFECVSVDEIEHLQASIPNIDAARILFTPSFAPRAEYERALEMGATVTLDNVEVLEHWPSVFKGRQIWLRVDLGHGDGHHEKVVTGGAASKFGLDITRLGAFVRAARALDIQIVGLHAHLGSGIESPNHWAQVYSELIGIAEQIGSIEWIDMGGGLPIPYTPDAEPFDLDAFGAAIAAIKAAFPRYKLACEPGRFLVAEAGVLLTRVTQVVQKSGVARIGVDAGMNALIRPSLYDAWHDIQNLSKNGHGSMGEFDVVGPICESGDVLGSDRDLPLSTAENDIILIADAGAYGMTMASRYNMRKLPREEIIE